MKCACYLHEGDSKHYFASMQIEMNVNRKQSQQQSIFIDLQTLKNFDDDFDDDDEHASGQSVCHR